MREEIESFFLNCKPVKILVCLYKPSTGNYASAVSRHVGATYSHTLKTLQEMHRMELIEFERQGRRKLANLTPRGQRLAKNFSEVLDGIHTSDRLE